MPLLLLERARGLLAELGAGARAVASLERGLEALDHGRGIVRALAAARTHAREREQHHGGEDRDRHRRLIPCRLVWATVAAGQRASMPTLASLWLDTVEHAPRPALGQDVHADVCVVGAGITGLSAALELARGGSERRGARGPLRRRGGERLQHREAELAARPDLREARAQPRRGRRAQLRGGQPARHRARLRAGRRARHRLRPAAQAEPHLLGVCRRPRADRGGGRGRAPRRAAGVAGRGDRPAVRDRRRGALRRPGRVPPGQVPARAGRRARGQRRAPLRGHVRGGRGRWLALPRAHRRRADRHSRERGGRHAPAVPRPRPLLRALPPRALVRGGRAVRGRRRRPAGCT